MCGLGVLLRLPDHVDDRDIAARAYDAGFAPTALSPWVAGARAAQGLLLGAANLSERRLAADCAELWKIVRAPS
jgi:GntR family transcriptional regulator/MocR family aminotransferase